MSNESVPGQSLKQYVSNTLWVGFCISSAGKVQHISRTIALVWDEEKVFPGAVIVEGVWGNNRRYGSILIEL